jgi:hypothetical protein
LEKYKTLRALALHHDIINAIEAHNPEQAKTAMRKHLNYNKKNIAEFMDAHALPAGPRVAGVSPASREGGETDLSGK